jgi:hypothetical protein
VGETIDQTRLEIAAQRAELDATVKRLRDALDLRRRVRESPGVVIGIGAVAAFLVAGGPRRLARILRGSLAPHAAEQAYEALPESMQAWVSALAGEAGPKASQVRDELVEELRRWRRDPIKDRKARKALARQMVDGPPGPQRTAWNAAETALTLLAAALARKAVARFLTDEPARKRSAIAAADELPAKAASKRRGDVAGSGEGYAGWSGRDKLAD